MANELKLPVPGMPFQTAAQTDLGLSPERVRSRGVFGEQPGMTPKYSRNQGNREPDFKESLARLFVQVGPSEYEQFVDSVPEESQALARVLAGTNQGMGGSRGGVGYIDFLLQSAPISLQEKIAVVETLADNYVLYTFGQSAPSFSYSGTLINTKQDDQAVNMLRIYRDMIRASQLARRKKTVRLRYDSYIVTGAAINLNMTQEATVEMAVPFSLTLIVKNILVLPNPDYAITVVEESFAPRDFLPKLVSGQLNPGPRALRLKAAPPIRTVPTTTVIEPTEQYSVKDVAGYTVTPEPVTPSFSEALSVAFRRDPPGKL
jgi:hypothetical protein